MLKKSLCLFGAGRQWQQQATHVDAIITRQEEHETAASGEVEDTRSRWWLHSQTQSRNLHLLLPLLASVLRLFFPFPHLPSMAQAICRLSRSRGGSGSSAAPAHGARNLGARPARVPRRAPRPRQVQVALLALWQLRPSRRGDPAGPQPHRPRTHPGTICIPLFFSAQV